MYKHLFGQCHRINRCGRLTAAVTASTPTNTAATSIASLSTAATCTKTTVVTLPNIKRNKTAAFCTSASTSSASRPHLLTNQPASTPVRTMASTTGATTTTPPPSEAEHTNRLAGEKSTYLLQHAHNPVNWFPWGDEAIALARSEQKLIFLSIGYSTCHWCHVMERESFENAEIAAQMNRDFVCIKVDREERPDLDRIYMNFVVMVNGSGGWPMSVWLTPDLAPISAGTYFPPVDRWGTPGFPTVLAKVQQKWHDDRENLVRVGLRVIDVLGQAGGSGGGACSGAGAELALQTTEQKFAEAVRIYYRNVDPDWGGFGRSPKFPEVSKLQFVLHANTHQPDGELLSVALDTLRRIADGGIHDHVFGGFARYSVDRKWHVPHFEKMLYDQGQLMQAYAVAHKVTGEQRYARVADGIFRYVCKDLQHPEGGFYSGEDADSLPEWGDAEKIEGAFYAWEWQELRDIYEENKAKFELAEAFDVFAAYFGCEEAGNVDGGSDPHGHLLTKNILMVQMTEERCAEKFGCDVAAVRKVVATMGGLLHEVRERRPRPHLDTKIITAWNGLMLSGLAKLATIGGGSGEKREEYGRVAAKLVAFLREVVWDEEAQRLYRTCYGEGVGSEAKATLSTPIDGFLDDYAFLIRGLLDYHALTADRSALQWARQLQLAQDQRFWDAEHDAYFYSEQNAANVVVRLKDDHDGAEPCGNSVATGNLMLLHSYFDEEEFRTKAAKVFAYFGRTTPFGFMLPEMLSAMLLHETGVCQVTVVGPKGDAAVRELMDLTRGYFIPGLVLLHVDPAAPAECVNPACRDLKTVDGKATVYICHKQVCMAPITEVAELKAKLDEQYRFQDV